MHTSGKAITCRKVPHNMKQIKLHSNETIYIPLEKPYPVGR